MVCWYNLEHHVTAPVSLLDGYNVEDFVSNFNNNFDFLSFKMHAICLATSRM